MNSFPVELVRVMLKKIGLRPMKRGKGGHAGWIDQHGRRVFIPLRNRDVPVGHLYSLGQVLEGLGIVSRRVFMTLLRNA